MTATANLENDHVHILLLTDIMEAITVTDEVHPEHLDSVVKLIRNFADGLHHNKEENLLFPAMAARGYSFSQGPVAVMMEDHRQGREFVKGMAEGIDQYKSGKKDAIFSVFRNMLGYVELLRSHIAKENNILFRMADGVLSDDEQKKMLQEFLTIESSVRSGENASGYIDEIHKLARVYNVLIS